MENPFELLEDRLRRIENLLIDLKTEIQIQKTSEFTDELLTVSQAAEMLSIAVPTIYGYVSKRQIPVAKKGKKLYFSRKELLEWVKQGRKRTLSEIENEATIYIKRNRHHSR